MKRSTFLAVGGVILAFFIVSAFGNKNNFYEKEKTFEKPEDAIINFIGYINTYEMVKDDNGYYYVPSRDFLESISKRYRMFVGTEGSNKFINDQVPVFFRYEMKEVDFNSLTNLKNTYNESFKNIPKYPSNNEVRVYKLDGYGDFNSGFEKSYVKEDGTIENIYDGEGTSMTLYLILVDEGEGYVVDYYSLMYQ
ncbi:hypothetical protein ACQPVP_04945 [Clostridium nigeriense]|uniref:hypothetical protein n=1 Tax=Clostridium nigeriense TaxID=1805470 RepID=UPI003D3592C7